MGTEENYNQNQNNTKENAPQKGEAMIDMTDIIGSPDFKFAGKNNSAAEKDEPPSYSSIASVKTSSKFIRWIIEHSGGKIKSEKEANYVLIAFLLIMIIISVYLIFSGDHYVEDFPNERYINKR
jgi:hypothetical protein